MLGAFFRANTLLPGKMSRTTMGIGCSEIGLVRWFREHGQGILLDGQGEVREKSGKLITAESEHPVYGQPLNEKKIVNGLSFIPFPMNAA